MIEQWRDIPSWEGYYQVSSEGRVRSLDRTIIRRNGMPYRAKSRILHPATCPHSWVRTVTLARAGHRYNACVHLLVRAAFDTEESAA